MFKFGETYVLSLVLTLFLAVRSLESVMYEPYWKIGMILYYSRGDNVNCKLLMFTKQSMGN